MSVTILTGDCLARLRELPDESVDCVVTSPPYWGLRDYGVPGQIGLERTLAEHIAALVAVFEEVRRILKPHGTVWINYGDCYATSPNGRSAAETKAQGTDDRTFRDKPFSTVQGGLKPKDLCMLPNRLAIALQDAGWWVRSEIVWGKPNAMPDSSGTARPSTAHEKIFLLTKSADADIWRARDTGEISFAPDLTERRPLVTKPKEEGARWIRLGAYYDAGGVMLRAAQGGAGGAVNGWGRDDEPRDVVKFAAGDRAARNEKRKKHPRATGAAGETPRHKGHVQNEGLTDLGRGNGRLLRNFEQGDALAELSPPDILAWEIAIAGFSGAHFATFPPALVVPCILAGCPQGGTVLDPFGGAGTTGLVADRLGREAILIELNDDYSRLARDRLRAALARVECALPENGGQEEGLFAGLGAAA